MRVLVWSHNILKERYRQEVMSIAEKKAGLHFTARKATHDQVLTFDIDIITDQMMALAPGVWRLLDVLLSADEAAVRRCRRRQRKKSAEVGEKRARSNTLHEETAQGDDEWTDSEDEYWQDEFLSYKKVVIISILANSTNQWCNTLQTMHGLYLHACNAPVSVLDLFAQLGISISSAAINDTVSSLSRKSYRETQQLGKTLLAAYAYDNFDVEVKQAVHTVESTHESLLHLTSGTMLRLDHGVTTDDLRCSDELWKQSKINPTNFRMPKSIDWTKLLTIHMEEAHPSGLTRRDQFCVWQFLHDLVHHGPEYFAQFRNNLGHPEVVDQIPVVKSKQIPVKGMDINQSTVPGNRDALINLFGQGGLGDPIKEKEKGVKDIGDHVILVHGDLSTCE
ncbi:hypothetical protein JAAARDRAFT_131575 [Jaapia argillacea MUCL 33604]|uniref:DUF6589 domain-containing protein n=1 Tax=Jaapia argillacea MUCL 33604 TaxID=933084 RepID=A0A067Q3Y9_9AGAM|nr:hypothetical protein JAAARDRAFT_131575 [Jaapia argillacea MUCL 33604]